ncbi:hypothetical protein JOL79_30735 [Microbispora sp. RL4-1S]|uniref:Uncharacterized protein n=1 Tax=Microbispora oryzae TaxID=2806554 RepID=A0A941ASF2_9ACTN|nr:hypothetical protein [Microbispora oryzae]MBP2708164.1 hypothetical protein [Microbispora oryzae]
MMRIFSSEMRASPLRWWLPVFVALDIAMLFGRDPSWIGVWPQASAAVQLAGHAFAAAAAAAATWSSGREHRTGVTDSLASSWRGRWQADGLQLASTLLFIAVPYALGAALAAATSLREAGPGFLWPRYLLLGASTLLLSASAGHLAGKLLPGRVAPTLAVAGLVVLLSIYGSPRLELVVLSGMPQVELAPLALGSRFLLAGVLALIAVVLPGIAPKGEAWRSRSRQAGMTGSAVLAVGSCVIAMTAAGPLRVNRPAPHTPLCSADTPRVCLWPDNAKYLPQVAAMASRLAALPAGLFRPPDTFYERGVLPGRPPLSGFLIIRGVSSVPDALAGSILERTLPLCDLTESDAPAYFRQFWPIHQWLSVRAYGSRFPAFMKGGPPGVDMEEIYNVVHRPEADQTAWVKAKLAAIKAIRPDCV